MEYQITTCADDTEMHGLPNQFRSVVDYWKDLCGPQFAPSWSDFRLDLLDPKVIPWCNVVDVIGEGKDFRYRFWGTSRHRCQSQDMTGKSVDDLTPHELAAAVRAEYHVVLMRRKPVWFDNRVIIYRQQDLGFQFLRLPLSSDGTTIDHILGISHNRHRTLEFETTAMADLCVRHDESAATA